MGLLTVRRAQIMPPRSQIHNPPVLSRPTSAVTRCDTSSLYPAPKPQPLEKAFKILPGSEGTADAYFLNVVGIFSGLDGEESICECVASVLQRKSRRSFLV